MFLILILIPLIGSGTKHALVSVRNQRGQGGVTKLLRECIWVLFDFSLQSVNCVLLGFDLAATSRDQS